jgi:hypothetical protein
MAYTTEASVRYMHYLFDSTNIPSAVVAQFISEAELEINTTLGLTTSMSTTDAAACNVSAAANLLCAIKCAMYDSSVFSTLEEQKETIKNFRDEYKNAMKTLKNYKGFAKPPIAFSPVSNTVSSTWWT